MEKVKKIAKYVTNILAIIGALIAGINAVDGTNKYKIGFCKWKGGVK